jgi:hypothetical protein
MDNPQITENGTKRWYNADDKFHRDGGPAAEWPNGDKYWFQHGKLHRDDGPALVWANGTKSWYQHGSRHRDDGPAYEHADGAKAWYQHGKLHRDDGPAVEYANGEDNEWRLNNNILSFEEWLDQVDISDENKVMMKLKYG